MKIKISFTSEEANNAQILPSLSSTARLPVQLRKIIRLKTFFASFFAAAKRFKSKRFFWMCFVFQRISTIYFCYFRFLTLIQFCYRTFLHAHSFSLLVLSFLLPRYKFKIQVHLPTITFHDCFLFLTEICMENLKNFYHYDKFMQLFWEGLLWKWCQLANLLPY